jgi:ABC-type transport system substrate-binding protein
MTNNKDYQIILTGVTNSINPDLTYFYGNNNIANYSNDDAMSILGSFDKYQELQKIVNNDCPYIPLYRNKGTLILNANVGGNFLPNNFNIYYNFEKWFRQR